MIDKCIIAFARAFDRSGNTIGDRLDQLTECCDRFKEFFNKTGHLKHTSFNSPYLIERDGLHLVNRGSNLKLLLRLTHPVFEDFIEYCMFCGKKIEIVATKAVTLESRVKEVPSGYNVIVKWQRSDETGDNNPQK